jgi:hypothetical protein
VPCKIYPSQRNPSSITITNPSSNSIVQDTPVSIHPFQVKSNPEDEDEGMEKNGTPTPWYITSRGRDHPRCQYLIYPSIQRLSTLTALGEGRSTQSWSSNSSNISQPYSQVSFMTCSTLVQSLVVLVVFFSILGLA